ncbi:MAG TPA: diguanylate cyclase [Natronosporangium sp.]
MAHLRLPAGFAGLVVALGAAYAITHQRWIWWAIGLAGVAAVAVGVLRYRPRRRAPWYLIMAALLALTGGYAAAVAIGDRGSDLPGCVAELVYLGVFVPLMVAAVSSLARVGVRAVDRIDRLDAVIIASGVALLAWTLLIGPTIGHATDLLLPTVIEVAYPVTSVFLVVLLVKLAATMRWTPALLTSVGGTLGMLTVNMIVGIARLRGEWLPGPEMVGWLLLTAGWGAAALHPTMVALGDAGGIPASRRFLSRGRLAVVTVGALLIPVHLIVEAVLRQQAELVVRRALTAVVIGLVLLRMAYAVANQRRGLQREQTLRTAGAQLVSATTVAEVTSVVRSAVTRLLPADTPHEVVLEVHEPPTGPPGRAAGSTLAAPRDDRTRSPAPSATADLSVLDGPVGHVGSLHHLPASGRAGRRGLPDTVHRCPVLLPARPDGEPEEVGVLYVTAPGALLADLQTTVEALAALAALALDRIRLTDEINRNASERYFRTLVQNAADMILIADPDGTVRYASPSATAVLGGGTPSKLCDLIAPEDHATLRRVMTQLTQGTGGGSAVTECTVVTSDLRRIRAEVTFRDLRADPTVDGVVVTLHDVTEQRRLQRELTFLAFHDALTGLANRALFYERLDRALTRHAHRAEKVGVLFLDLDDLKQINDTLGHAAGDELLVAAAHRLSATVGVQDTVARLGGDEFAALLEDIDDPAVVGEIARRVVAAFEAPFQLAGRSVRVGVSVGAAVATPGMDGDELLRCADVALYEAKNAGKACWRWYNRARDTHLQRQRPTAPEPGADPLPARPAAERDPDRSPVRSATAEPDSDASPARPAGGGPDAGRRWVRPTILGRILPGQGGGGTPRSDPAARGTSTGHVTLIGPGSVRDTRG